MLTDIHSHVRGLGESGGARRRGGSRLHSLMGLRLSVGGLTIACAYRFVPTVCGEG